MSFIEELYRSFERDFKKILNGTYKYPKKNWCIGSGSNFEIYKKMTFQEAKQIFLKLDIRQCCGKKEADLQKGEFLLQEFRTMESNSGHTFLFMFPVKLSLNKKYENK